MLPIPRRSLQSRFTPLRSTRLTTPRRPARLISALLLPLLGLAPIALADTDTFLKDMYGEQIKAVQATRDTADDLALARRLVADAQSIPDSPGVQVALFEQAIALCTGSIEAVDVATNAIDQLYSTVPDQPLTQPQRVLQYYDQQSRVIRGADLVKFTGRHLQAHLEAGDEALSRDDLRTANHHYTEASRLASRLTGLDRTPIDKRLRTIRDAQRIEQQIAALERTLERGESTAAAGTLARILFAEKQDTQRALELAAKANDPALVANLTAAGKPVADLDPATALSFADWLVELSRPATEAGKIRLLLMAIDAYEHFLASHDKQDLLRLTTARKLAAAREALPPDAAVRVQPWLPLINNTVWSGKFLILPGNQRDSVGAVAAALVRAQHGERAFGRVVSERIAAPWISGPSDQTLFYVTEILSPEAQTVTLDLESHPSKGGPFEVHHRGKKLYSSGEFQFVQGVNVVAVAGYFGDRRERRPMHAALRLVGKGLEVKAPAWASVPDKLQSVTWQPPAAGQPVHLDRGLQLGPVEDLNAGVVQLHRHLAGEPADLGQTAPKPFTMDRPIRIEANQTHIFAFALRCDTAGSPLVGLPQWSRHFQVLVNGTPAMADHVQLKQGENVIVVGITNRRGRGEEGEGKPTDVWLRIPTPAQAIAQWPTTTTP